MNIKLYQSILENIFLRVGDLFLGTVFVKELNKWRGIQYSTEPELKKKAEGNLIKILAHAVENINYYKNLNIELSNNPYEDIKKFPIVDKERIHDNLENMLLSGKNNLIKQMTSGSSGIQGTTYVKKRERSISQALQTLFWTWSGYHIGAKSLQTGMQPNRGVIKKIKDFCFRTTYVTAFNLADEIILQKLEDFRNQKEVFFGGYASGLYSFAQVAEKNNITDIKFDAVISWGDKMFPHYRELIQRVFHTKVFDYYGCSEGIQLAGQCEHGNYHIMSPHVYIELLDNDNNPVKAGEIGNVVVTRLDAFAMPLIRYKLGDLAIKAHKDEVCQCKRNLPMLKKIIGRDTDIVKTPSGKNLIVHFFTGIIEYHDGIKQYRIIQKDLLGITIEYIENDNFNTDCLQRIKDQMFEKADEIFEVAFNKVDFIPATSSGKPQIILSEIQ